MRQAGAVVLGLTLNGLGVARSLAMAGVPVVGVYQDREELGRLSRHCADTVHWTTRGRTPADLTELCKALAQHWEGHGVVYPTSDDFVELLAKAEVLEPPLYVAVGQSPLLRAVLDKQHFAKLVTEAGCLAPRTIRALSLEQILAFMGKCNGKALVKPRISHRSAGKLGSKVVYLASETEAKNLWEVIAPWADELVLQEVVEDSPCGIVVYLGYRSRDGRRLVGCTGRKLRQIPVDGGTAACVRLEDVPGLTKLVETFITAIDYRGLFGLEFKWHQTCKQFCLLDMSARTELFHTVALAGGLNLPYLAHLDCAGPWPPIRQPVRPACWIRVEHELAAIKRLWCRGISPGHLLSGYRGRLCLAVFSVKDPLPFLGYCAEFARRVRRRLTQKTGGTATCGSDLSPKDVARSIVCHVGAPAAFRWHHRMAPVVVAYHGIVADSDSQDWETADMVAESRFRQHLEFYRRHYNVVPLRRIAKTLATQDEPLPRCSLAITFDDGFRNNLTFAVPALEEYGFVATFFLTTGFLDGSAELWWLPLKRCILMAHRSGSGFRLPGFGNLPVSDYQKAGESYRKALDLLKELSADERTSRLQELERAFSDASELLRDVYDPLTWDEVREMAGRGMEIGAHTVTHPILSRESEDRARREVYDSVRRIKEELSSSDLPFSYPNGQRADFAEDTEDLVRQAGCYAAVAGFPGFNRKAGHLYQLRRFPIGGHHTVHAVELDLCGLRHGVKRILGLLRRSHRDDQ